MTILRSSLLFPGLALWAGLLAAEPPRPALDAQRIINQSYGFLKDQEPQMTADEYALYEKAVSLISVQPAFGLKLLEQLVAGAQERSPAFELALGNVHYTNGKPEQAEAYYRKALQRHPAFQRAWTNLAALLYAQGRYAEAIPCFTKAVSGGRADANTLGVLAYCHARVGNTVAAEMNYLQAAGLEPENADWLNGLVSLSLESKQYGRAEVLLKQLVRVKPRDRQARILYASVLSHQNRTVEAVAVLDAARSLGLVDHEGLLFLGDLCAELRLSREAIDAYRTAMAQGSKLGAERLIRYAQSQISAGRLQEADATLAAVPVDLPPETRVSLLRTRSECAIAGEDWVAAQRDLEGLLTIQPLDGPALVSLGRVYKARQNLSSADLVLEQAARLPLVGHRACLEIADIAVRRRQYQRAIDYLERALAMEKSQALQQYIAKLKLLVSKNEIAPAG